MTIFVIAVIACVITAGLSGFLLGRGYSTRRKLEVELANVKSHAEYLERRSASLLEQRDDYAKKAANRIASMVKKPAPVIYVKEG